jgi:hypothetical protein
MTWEPLPGRVDHTRPLASVLERMHVTLGFARPDTVVTLERHWTSLLGIDLAARCELESLHHETLVIRVSDPAVAEHLRWSSREILDAVNSICGGEVARELKVRIRSSTG